MRYELIMKNIYVFFGVVGLLILLGLVACTDRQETSKVLVKEGKRLQVMGQNREAMEKFERAIKKDEKNFEAWYLKGNCEITLGDLHTAISDLSKAISLREDFAPAWYNRGLAYFYLDQRDEACADWKQAEKLGQPNISDRTRHCH
jgi:tetratricopeptide (TPR) repeat protein